MSFMPMTLRLLQCDQSDEAGATARKDTTGYKSADLRSHKSLGEELPRGLIVQDSACMREGVAEQSGILAKEGSYTNQSTNGR